MLEFIINTPLAKYYYIFVAISSFSVFAIGFFVLFKNIKSKTNIFYFLYSFALGWWFLGSSFSMYFFQDTHLTFLLWKIGYMTIPFMPVFFYHFYLEYTEKKVNFLLKFFYFISSLEFIILLIYDKLGKWVIGVQGIGAFWTEFHLGSIILLFGMLKFLFISLLTGFSFYLDIKRETKLIKKGHYKLFSVIVLINAVGGIFEWSPDFGIPLRIAWILVPFFVWAMAYNIIHFKAFDIETVIHKTMMWLSVSVLLFFPMLEVLYVTRGFLSGLAVVLQFFIYLVVLMFFVKLYNIFQPKIDFFFKRKNHKLEKDADNLVSAFSTIIDLSDLITVLEIGIKNLFFSRGAKVFLKKDESYVSSDDKVSTDLGIIDYMRESKEEIEKDLVLADPKYNKIMASATAWFSKNDYVLLVPIFMKDDMNGFLALGKRDNLQPYSDFHIGVLQKVLRSFAVSLNNAGEHKRLIDVEKARKEEFERYNIKLAKEKTTVENLLKQKTRFINQLSHDLKTPLTPLLNLLPALNNNISIKERKQLVDICIKNSKYLENLVSDTLKIGEMESVKSKLNLEKTNLHKLLKTIIEARKERSLKIKNNIDKNLTLMVDPNKTRQVFENIIDNGVKYNENKVKKIIVVSKIKSNSLVISFEDNGIGIAKKDLKNVFEEFYKIDPSRHSLDSSGLGLSIVRRIVNLHNGKVLVQSKGKNKGSTFTIEISQNRKKL